MDSAGIQVLLVLADSVVTQDSVGSAATQAQAAFLVSVATRAQAE